MLFGDEKDEMCGTSRRRRNKIMAIIPAKLSKAILALKANRTIFEETI